MALPDDGAEARARPSVREVKDLAAAALAKSRQVRDARARRRETDAADGLPAGGPPSLRGEARGLLARCEAARDASRQLAASASATRRAAGEGILAVKATRLRLLHSREPGACPDDPGSAPRVESGPSAGWNREEGP